MGKDIAKKSRNLEEAIKETFVKDTVPVSKCLVKKFTLLPAYVLYAIIKTCTNENKDKIPYKPEELANDLGIKVSLVVEAVSDLQNSTVVSFSCESGIDYLTLNKAILEEVFSNTIYLDAIKNLKEQNEEENEEEGDVC